MKRRLLKFDIIHPQTYLEKKKAEWSDIDELSAAQYRDRLISLRSNYSDFYTHYLRELGWVAEEFFLLDETYIDKLGRELFGMKAPIEKAKSKVLHNIRPNRFGWTKRVIQAYIEEFQPDVLFIRSQTLPSSYWQQFREDCLLVARLSAKMPPQWHPQDWDLIYTDIESFKTFFEAHNVSSKLNKQGFDPRIQNDLTDSEKRYDVTFVGGVGTENFSRRTKLLEKVAGEVNFKWWGYWWEYGGEGSLDDFPNLKKSFQGPVSGLEMYQIYKDSKIVLNDYVDIDITHNIGYNQRMFEVMGIGGCMLTRNADNLEQDFAPDIFETFESAEDCINKIKTLLDDDKRRSQIGENAKSFIQKNYHYRNIVEAFHNDLIDELDQ